MRARAANVCLGAWLALSPWIWRYTSPQARHNDLWSGVVIFVIALVSLGMPWVRLVNAPAGVWLILSPFLLLYPVGSAPFLNDLIVGVLVLSASLSGGVQTKFPVRVRRFVEP